MFKGWCIKLIDDRCGFVFKDKLTAEKQAHLIGQVWCGVPCFEAKDVRVTIHFVDKKYFWGTQLFGLLIPETKDYAGFLIVHVLYYS